MIREWKEYPCPECKAPILLDREPILACPNCMEWFYEDLASKIDPSYDKTKINSFPDVWKALKKLWCYPQSKDGEDKISLKTVAGIKTGRSFKREANEIVPVLVEAPLW